MLRESRRGISAQVEEGRCPVQLSSSREALRRGLGARWLVMGLCPARWLLLMLVMCFPSVVWMYRFPGRNPKGNRSEWRGSRANSYSKPTEQESDSITAENKKDTGHHLARNITQLLKGGHLEGAPAPNSSAHCFLQPLKKVQRWMHVSAFLVLSSNNNSPLARAPRSTYQQEKVPDRARLRQVRLQKEGEEPRIVTLTLRGFPRWSLRSYPQEFTFWSQFILCLL